MGSNPSDLLAFYEAPTCFSAVFSLLSCPQRETLTSSSHPSVRLMLQTKSGIIGQALAKGKGESWLLVNV